ncbi:hypothetical protein HW114_02855 [Serratia symbiotica]|uniref:hypothetical protein n=1 Tax=Serratia symbiotica TaxID=138074 RepID=UPI0018887CB5|nr:hypothetical protein [Serratia symbiotica]MBF1994536.1 hypothetical protein [Serratia symbiotica]
MVHQYAWAIIAARRLNAFSSLGLNIALGGGLPVDRIAKTQTPGASSKTCPVGHRRHPACLAQCAFIDAKR